MIDFLTRIQNAVQYLQSQKDVDPKSGKIFMPIITARRIMYQQKKKFPRCLSVCDPAMCSDHTLYWFGCVIDLGFMPSRKVTVCFVKKSRGRIFRRKAGGYAKIPPYCERICIDIPIPEELQKCRA